MKGLFFKIQVYFRGSALQMDNWCETVIKKSKHCLDGSDKQRVLVYTSAELSIKNKEEEIIKRKMFALTKFQMKKS